MKKLLILHTGGTIAMQEDQATGAVAQNLENPLLAVEFPTFPNLELITEDFLHLPSPHMTPVEMLALKERIQQAVLEGISSVVITHGTDTLEETAYFLDTTIGNQVPIVLTGAMRSSNEIGSDGLYNFISAIKVAASDKSQGKGTLVVMNDEIHSAKYVTKTHTTNVATFRTPTFGPIGLIHKDEVHFFQKIIDGQRIDVQAVIGNIPIIKAYAGMDSAFLELLATTALDGLIIEALGAGNLPPLAVPALQKVLAKNIPVVLVSRCFNGIAEPVYDYEGGGAQLKKMGIHFCVGLNSQKARIKLLIAQNAHLTGSELAQFLSE